MAITRIFTRKDRIDHLIDCISNGKKTKKCRYVSGLNCTHRSAAEMMRTTYLLNGKPLRVESYHVIQSFKSGETDVRTAHEIGVGLAERMRRGHFQAVVAAHLNTQTCHNHIALCSTSFIDGKRCHSCKDPYQKLRDTSQAPFSGSTGCPSLRSLRAKGTDRSHRKTNSEDTHQGRC